MNKIYYDGDSHSFWLPEGCHMNTGRIIADRLGYDLDHYGYSGKSPNKIIRGALRYSFENPNALLLIGIGVPNRFEMHLDDIDDYAKRIYPYKHFQNEHDILDLNVHNIDDFAPNFLDILKNEYWEIQILFQCVMLHDYLAYNNINFLIHNLGWNFFTDKDFPFCKGIEKQVRARKRILNFYENSLHNLCYDANIKPWDYEKYQWHGHPSEEGHAMYADFLMENIIE